ncbi:hypothetical protein HPB48_024769 [Haemaphysalis longicornis]|uniref:Reverse transcriptase domain-containing protein n=1 Tax=Haemaphysalis longicornis TaxID=44386 RepID=A0A9J6H8L1_HAELO|nr:hypothetical protein HPB48_024769 [Haemaphysalis longicornis]
MEMKHADKSQLYLAFLDMEKAYDSIPHQKLWGKLSETQVGAKFIDIIKGLYTDCTAVYNLHDLNSKEIKLTVGLKQGCPLSPTLFNIYMNNLLKTLDEEGPGLRLSTTTTEGKEVYTKISSLAFADDIVLMAESEADLQHLLDICTRVAREDKLTFNQAKTNWMGLNVDATVSHTFLLQGKKI